MKLETDSKEEESQPIRQISLSRIPRGLYNPDNDPTGTWGRAWVYVLSRVPEKRVYHGVDAVTAWRGLRTLDGFGCDDCTIKEDDDDDDDTIPVTSNASPQQQRPVYPSQQTSKSTTQPPPPPYDPSWINRYDENAPHCRVCGHRLVTRGHREAHGYGERQ